MTDRKIKVMIVDDSASIRQLLSHVLGSDPGIEVIGALGSGAEALEFLSRVTPDVITVDINMPAMNGFELTRRIMESRPYPVVIVSASSPAEVATTFNAVEAGAVAVVGTPRGPGHPLHADEVKKLVQTVKSMSEVKVIRRWPRARARPIADPLPPQTAPRAQAGAGRRSSPIRLVAVGASTGGPVVLQTILANLPSGFPAPVLIVQHIIAGFLQGLSEWLGNTTGFPIVIAEQGQRALGGHAYLAPDGFHMGIGPDARIVLAAGASDAGLRPSVCHLFRSVAASFGPAAAGVLLTGMGRDGAESLLLMKQKGALTIAQDQESSVVFGMPGEAVKLGAASYVLPPDRIAGLLAGAADWR